MIRRPRHRGRTTDRGSAAVELVLVTPLLMLLLLVVVALGRLAEARLIVADAAHQAARAATLARTEDAARRQADHAASTAAGEAGAACKSHRLTLTTGGLEPGSTVTVRLTCTADLGDLTKTGMPGHISLNGTATSPVDAHRGTP